MGELNKVILGATITVWMALILIIVGLATPNWSEYVDGSHMGLFKICSVSTCFDIDDYWSLTDLLGDIETTRVLALIGFTAALLSVLSCTALTLSGFTDILTAVVRFLPHITFSLAVGGGVLTIIGCIVYGTAYFKSVDVAPGAIISYDPGFSFFLSLIGHVMLIVAEPLLS